MLRRSFLKLATGVFAACVGLVPDLAFTPEPLVLASCDDSILVRGTILRLDDGEYYVVTEAEGVTISVTKYPDRGPPFSFLEARSR